MWIRNAWYVAGWASELETGKTLARTFLGEPVVLYRDEKGKPVAMEDRCCHRFAPLSKGRVEGNCLRCMYHGLLFDPSGACVEVPGSDKVGDNLQVATYPVVESQKLLWIWMGDPAMADPSDIVEWPAWTDPDWPYKVDRIHYDSNYLLIVDNLLDFSHLGFLHANTIGSSASKELPAKISEREFGVTIEKYWLDDDPAPHHRKYGGLDGKVDRWNSYDWHVRGNMLLMEAGAVQAGSVTYENGVPEALLEQAIRFRHTSILTPETEGTTHYFFCHARNFATDDRQLTDDLHDAVLTAFREDQEMIEAQQKIIDGTDPARRMKSIPADEALLALRRRIMRTIKAEEGTLQAAE